MSVASHSQANAVYYRSMDHAHYPVKHQPPSYDAAMGRQVKECKSTDNAPPVKALKNGVSEAALSAGRGHEDRNVKWLPKDDERKSAGDAAAAPAAAPVPAPAARQSSAKAAASVAPVPANLPSAAELKKQIAKFLENNLSKSSSKAKAVAARIPTDDPVRLKNVIDVLKCMKIDRGMRYDKLKENLSWPADTLCCWNDYRGTSADDRLTLRALMLYVLSNVDVSARDSNPTQYAQMIKSAVHYGMEIKALDVDYLRNSTSDSILIHGEHGHVVPEGARIMPTIVKQLEEITAKL